MLKAENGPVLGEEIGWGSPEGERGGREDLGGEQPPGRLVRIANSAWQMEEREAVDASVAAEAGVADIVERAAGGVLREEGLVVVGLGDMDRLAEGVNLKELATPATVGVGPA